MEDKEILEVTNNKTQVSIVEDILFIGDPDEKSERPDLGFHFDEDGFLVVESWTLSKVQLVMLKAFLNKEY